MLVVVLLWLSVKRLSTSRSHNTNKLAWGLSGRNGELSDGINNFETNA
jgi:hypothetical protein